jgi:hypothetical protein
MAHRTWDFTLDGETHRVELWHGPWRGNRRIVLDGRQVLALSLRMFDAGSSHRLDVPGHVVEVRIVTNGYVYRYLLVVDGIPYFANEDAARPGKLLLSSTDQQLQWVALGQALGLTYLPMSGARLEWNHRLLGWWRGYFLVVQYTHARETYQPRVLVLLRYTQPFDVAVLRSQLTSDPDLVGLWAGNSKAQPSIEGDYLTFSVPHFSRKVTAAQVAESILKTLNGVVRYVQPLKPGQCDADNCHTPSSEPRQWVLINHYPVRLCASCEAGLGRIGEQNLQAYRASPPRLGLGVLVGLGTAAVGGVLLAVLTVALKAVAAVFGGAVFALVVRVMNKVGTKLSRLSLVVAAGIAMLGVFLAAYLVMLWYSLSAAPGPLSPDLLWRAMRLAWEAMWSHPSLLYLMLFFNVLGIGLYLISSWLDLRGKLATRFRPIIEPTGFAVAPDPVWR